jgi:hypothetical protein
MQKYTMMFSSGIGEEIYRELFQLFIEIKQGELIRMVAEGEVERRGYESEKNNMSFLNLKSIN